MRLEAADTSLRQDSIPKQSGFWPDYAGTMIACFSGMENGVAAGELWSFYFEQPHLFHGLDELLFAMESVMDEAGKPTAWCERRTLRVKQRRRNAERERAYVPPPKPQEPYYGPEALAVQRGRLCTAAICVRQRQNASMQGELRLPPRDPVCFRSALELLYLLREALESAQREGKY